MPSYLTFIHLLIHYNWVPPVSKLTFKERLSKSAIRHPLYICYEPLSRLFPYKKRTPEKQNRHEPERVEQIGLV